MKSAKSLAVVMFTVLMGVMTSAHAARLVPVAGYDNNSVPTVGDKPVKLEDIKKGIMRAAVQRGYQVKGDAGNKVRLLLDKPGKYQLTIDVIYSMKSYSIKYVSSEGLDYREDGGQGMIHRNYDRWMKFLVQSINKELSLASI